MSDVPACGRSPFIEDGFRYVFRLTEHFGTHATALGGFDTLQYSGTMLFDLKYYVEFRIMKSGVQGLLDVEVVNSQWISAVLLVLLLAIAIIDFRQMRIPDWLNASFFVIGAGGVLGLERMSPEWALLSSVIGGAVFLGIRWAYQRIRNRPGLGLGDVKFIAAAGLWVGLDGLPSMVLWASLAALAVVAGLLVVRGPIAASDKLPFGPFLALGLWIVWVYGPI